MHRVTLISKATAASNSRRLYMSLRPLSVNLSRCMCGSGLSGVEKNCAQKVHAQDVECSDCLLFDRQNISFFSLCSFFGALVAATAV